MISVVNLDIGNIASVLHMLNRLGEDSCIITNPDQNKTNKIIIPGVGHFDEGLRRLHSRGLSEAITSLVKDNGVQILGICLGMQLLCRTSEEGSSRAWIS